MVGRSIRAKALPLSVLGGRRQGFGEAAATDLRLGLPAGMTITQRPPDLALSGPKFAVGRFWRVVHADPVSLRLL
jgi:hypothetical protein